MKKIAKFFLIIIFIIIIVNIVILIKSISPNITYNGITNNAITAYINIEIENDTYNDLIISADDFCVKSETSSAITAKDIYLVVDNNYTYEKTLLINKGETKKYRLVYNKADIPERASLYYKGKEVCKL